MRRKSQTKAYATAVHSVAPGRGENASRLGSRAIIAGATEGSGIVDQPAGQLARSRVLGPGLPRKIYSPVHRGLSSHV
jgi:hypothetical protein